jgi:hypothetical protein
VATENFVRIAAIAFLTNHASQIMAADLFVVPTVTFRLLFVLVILGHNRRRRNAFSEHDAPRYLVHDRDSVFADVATTVAGMNMQTVRTAPRSPWQNAYAERVIGSIRRECLDLVDWPCPLVTDDRWSYVVFGR